MTQVEKFLHRGDTKLWTVRQGDGIPAIFLNGGPGCDDYLQDVAAMIDDLCQVVRFEPRGCGRSSWDGHYDLSTAVADIDFVRREYGFEKVLLLGHSWGPDLGLAYLLRYPRHVLGLIGIAGGRIVNDRDWHKTYHDNEAVSGENSNGEFHADPRVNILGNETYKEFIRQQNLLLDIAGIECPVTYINAGEDIRPDWPTRQLAALIPKGQYIEIPGAKHYIWLSHARELAHLLRSAIGNLDIND
jgi:pimeloyl-ACP methyl ester carboxylesterase